jgi:hypothetical protein
MNREEQIRIWQQAAQMNEAKKVNPYAVCTAKVGRENEEKYKKCKQEIEKKQS